MKGRLKTIPGRELKVGDVVEFLGGLHTVERFSDHPGLADDRVRHPGRVAWSGGWSITVLDDEDVRVLDTTPDPEREAFARFLDGLLA